MGSTGNPIRADIKGPRPDLFGDHIVGQTTEQGVASLLDTLPCAVALKYRPEQ